MIRGMACACAVAMLVARAAPAPAGGATDWRVDVGFGGTYRAGSWTPLVVTTRPGAASSGDRVHVWAEDPDGQFVRSPAASLNDDGAGGLRARFQVRVGRPRGRVRIEHVGPTADRSAAWFEAAIADPLPATHRVLLVVGDLPSARRAARLMTDGEEPPLDVVGLGDAAARRGLVAGESARDFDSADCMLVCGAALGDLDPAAVEGIDAWVRGGGRLVLAAGPSAAAVAAGLAADWLPGPIERFVPLRRTAALEAYARAAGLSGRPAAAALTVPLFANRSTLGRLVEAFEGTSPGDLPLVVRRPHGFGTITWIGLDLDAEPCRGWPAADSLLVRLLGGRPPELDATATTSTAAPVDLAGQLRVALERADGAAGRIRPVPFEIIVGLGLLYVACLYPLDWWLAARGRARLAWLSLPFLVAGFTAAARAIAAAWQPETAVNCRTAELVDIDAADRTVRGAAWAVVWKKTNGSLDVAVRPAGADAAVSWWADAGRGLGGVDAPLAHPALAARDYRYAAALDGLVGEPVAASASRLFEARWFGAAMPAPAVVSSLARDAQGTLQGAVTHHLPVPLVDARLAFGGWVYDVGRLAPGVSHDLGQGRGPRSLAGALARRVAARDREAAAAWNPQETDVAWILEVAGLHAAAGGAAYTGVGPGRLAALDLSPLLADRAILMGRVEEPPPSTAAWSVTADGAAVEPIASICRLVRIVIPVLPSGEAQP